MNAERDKFLTEAMCHKYHESCQFGVFLTRHDNGFGESLYRWWEFFGLLWDWAQKREWWDLFINTDMGIVSASLVNPDRFADAVYQFLKESK